MELDSTMRTRIDAMHALEDRYNDTHDVKINVVSFVGESAYDKITQRVDSLYGKINYLLHALKFDAQIILDSVAFVEVITDKFMIDIVSADELNDANGGDLDASFVIYLYVIDDANVIDTRECARDMSASEVIANAVDMIFAQI